MFIIVSFKLTAFSQNMEKILFIHRTLNFGIAGDKMQNVLWRLNNLSFPPNLI